MVPTAEHKESQSSLMPGIDLAGEERGIWEPEPKKPIFRGFSPLELGSDRGEGWVASRASSRGGEGC